MRRFIKPIVFGAIGIYVALLGLQVWRTPYNATPSSVARLYEGLFANYSYGQSASSAQAFSNILVDGSPGMVTANEMYLACAGTVTLVAGVATVNNNGTCTIAAGDLCLATDATNSNAIKCSQASGTISVAGPTTGGAGATDAVTYWDFRTAKFAGTNP